jgi:GNAT superfamily N-acetyltransferase
VPVRDATPDDVDEILALIVELAEYEAMADDAVAGRDALQRHLFGPFPVARVLMAEPADPPEPVRPAGFALWYPTFSTFLGRPGIWLEDLYVRPAHRREGLGRALLAHLRGLTDGRVEWAVLDWNEPAIAFYRRLGAEPVTGWTRYRWLPGAG